MNHYLISLVNLTILDEICKISAGGVLRFIHAHRKHTLLWEKTAIDSVTRGCERLNTEVFRSEDLDLIKERCDKFFSLMPELINE